MKYLFSTVCIIILYSICLPNKAFPVTDNQLITELRIVNNDSTFRYLYLYDNLANKVLETKYYRKDSTWIRTSQVEWIYNGRNCTAQRERCWKENGWVLTYAIDYEFKNQRLNSEIHTTYNNGVATLLKKSEFRYDVSALTSKSEYGWQSNGWILIHENDFRYGDNGQTDSIIITNFQSGRILSQMLSTFSYASDGTIKSQLYQEKTGDSWVNAEKINWYYVSNSVLVTSIRNKKWLENTSSWENTQCIDYQYNNTNNLVSETYKRWKIAFWQNDIRYDYTYQSTDILLKKTLSIPIYTDWRSTMSINYSNFTQNRANKIVSIYEFWGGTTGQLATSYIPFQFNNELTIQKGSSIGISYAPVSETALYSPVENNTYHLIPVYPNPSLGMFYINTQRYTLKSWNVSDIKGRVLKSQVQTYQSGVIDLTDLPNGIYILQVTTPDDQLIQKLIKE